MALTIGKKFYFQSKAEVALRNYDRPGNTTLIEGAIVVYHKNIAPSNEIVFKILENLSTVNSGGSLGYFVVCGEAFAQSFFDSCNYVYRSSKNNCVNNKNTGNPRYIWGHPSNHTSKPKYTYGYSQLCSLFKYIPIKYIDRYSDTSSFEGFYDVQRKIGIRLNGASVAITPKIANKGVNGFIKRDKRGSKSKIKSKKVISKIISNINESMIMDEYYDPSTILKYCKFKLKSYQYSSDLYGRVNQKKLLVGKLLTPSEGKEIELFQIDANKLETEYIHSMYFNTEFGNLKFDLRDIEIIYPNIQGYHIPFNRKISIGDVVKCIVPKNIGNKLALKEEVIVVDIKYLGDNKRYIGWVKNFSAKNVVYSDIKAFKKYKETTLKSKEVMVAPKVTLTKNDVSIPSIKSYVSVTGGEPWDGF